MYVIDSTAMIMFNLVMLFYAKKTAYYYAVNHWEEY